jgi:hypothetical protein
MSILEKLSSVQNHNDAVQDIELAKELVISRDAAAIRELVDNLDNKNKRIQSDCIKVLYEIGERGAPELIEPYFKEFGKLLDSKNNRLVWGAMTALDMIASVDPGRIFNYLTKIITTMETGSVITNDHGISMLGKLGSIEKYEESAVPLLLEQLKRCPAKQLPMYYERTIDCVNNRNKNQFLELIHDRYQELETDSRKKRVDKILKKINNIK